MISFRYKEVKGPPVTFTIGLSKTIWCFKNIIWLDSSGSSGLYHSCQVVGGGVPENVCLCLLYFFTFCEQSTFIKNFKFSNIHCLLLIN